MLKGKNMKARIVILGLFLSACGSSLGVTEDDKYEAKVCSNYVLFFESALFLQTSQSSSDEQKNMIDKCGSLSDGALKTVFLDYMASEFNVEIFEILEEKMVDYPAAVGNRKYMGKAETLNGTQNFSAYLSDKEGYVVKIGR